MAKPKPRCFWCGDDPLYVAYHDDEWGVPVHDDRQWFEKLILDGAQAGLSWLTMYQPVNASTVHMPMRALDHAPCSSRTTLLTCTAGHPA